MVGPDLVLYLIKANDRPHALIDQPDNTKEFLNVDKSALLHRGQGLWLQYDDSRIIDEILMKMVSKKIPVLPVMTAS